MTTEQLLSWIIDHPDAWIAVDTETTGIEFIRDGRHYCIGVSVAARVGTEVVGDYIPVNHPSGGRCSPHVYDLLCRALEGARRIFFQNAKFDIFSLRTAGIYLELSTLFFIDCAVAAQLIDENTPRTKDLDALSWKYLGKEGKVKDEYVEKEKKTGNQNITPEQMNGYAVQDAITTFELGFKLRDLLHVHGLDTKVWQQKMRVLKLLIKMEGRGVLLDQKLCRELAVKGRAEMERLQKDIGLNPGSPKQLKTLLIDELGLPVLKKTPKGAPSFTADTMTAYDVLLEKMDSPVAKLIKAYRGWQKATTASYEPYLRLVAPDGRIRCNYRLDTARTGRFSSQDPNLQQVPKEGDKPWNEKTKKVFVPAPGYVLVNADFSQLELRLATVYAREEKLRGVFEEGRDIFTEMSKQLGMTRQDTKTLTYSMQYGAGVTRLKNAFGIDTKRATALRQNYFRTYPAFKKLSDQCELMVKNDRTVPIWTGRKRHFEYESESYKAMNSVIQGGAADIVECVMLKLEEELDDEDECRMLLQIHDAIVFEIREDLVDEYIPAIKAVMEDVVGATGEEEFGWVKFAVEVAPDYGSKGWIRQEEAA